MRSRDSSSWATHGVLGPALRRRIRGPPASLPSLLGCFRDTPAVSRTARRRFGAVSLAPGAPYGGKAHALHQHISSARAIGTRRRSRHDPRVAQADVTLSSSRWRPGSNCAAAAGTRATAGSVARLGRGPPRSRSLTSLHRTLFLYQTKNLTTEELQTLAELVASPVGSELRIARYFHEGVVRHLPRRPRTAADSR
jgi:hypothetical protein